MRSIATKGLISLLSLEFRTLPWAIGSMPFQGVSDAINSNQRADFSFVFGIQGVATGLVAHCPFRAFPMRSIATKGLISLLSLEFRALPWAIGSMPLQGVSDAITLSFFILHF